jgi:peptidoglycan/xylan/chitin deacetylase (PgdA/CDA1 family)
MDAILDYVLFHFYRIYGLPQGAFDIAYGLGGNAPVQIFKGETGFFEGTRPFPEEPVWQEWQRLEIPFFFNRSAEMPLLRLEEGRAIIGYDVVASAFYLLSGWQEYHSPTRDRLGRFPYAGSVQHRYGFITVPLVNYYLDILKTAVEHAYQIELKPRQWGENTFATCLTHDIDRYESAWKIAAQEELKRGNWAGAAGLLLQKARGRDAWSNLPDVMKVLHKHGARATFFFLAEHRKYQGHPNADYDLTASRYQRLLAELEGQGHEVAVHGSHATSGDPERLRQEQARLGRPVRGNRFHYLRYDPRLTPGVLEESGLAYDSSLGFAEHFGFRHACCHPFFPFDFKNRRPHRVLQIPLHLMDVTLHHPHYLQLDQADMLGAVKPMIAEIQKFGGCFTLLWHNENFADHAFPGAARLFDEIISHVASQKALFLTGSEIWAAFNKSPQGPSA